MNRYITAGVSAELSPCLQLSLWLLYDSMDEERDYLQIFDLLPVGESYQKIIHRQEQPAYLKELMMLSRMEPVSGKVYIIQEGNIETMLLASEY